MRGGREAVLNAAMVVFARKGYAGASIREICKAAGVTKPVLYYYFGGKEQLYQELMVDSFGHYLKVLLNASMKSGDFRQRLTGVVYDDLRSVKEAPDRARFILRMVFSPEGRLPYFNYVHEMERQRKVFAGVLQEAIDAGEIRGSARDLATALMGMDLIAILEHICTGRDTLTRRTAKKNVDVLLRGCYASPECIPRGKAKVS